MDVKMMVPRIHRDRRGVFSEAYNEAGLEVLNAKLEFVQDNHSLSVECGVVRGLHFKIPPFAQDKHVRYPGIEITDVNNFYVQEGNLTYEVLEGWWSDQERLNLSYAPTTWWPRQGANKLTDIGETAAVMIQEATR